MKREQQIVNNLSAGSLLGDPFDGSAQELQQL